MCMYKVCRCGLNNRKIDIHQQVIVQKDSIAWLHNAENMCTLRWNTYLLTIRKCVIASDNFSLSIETEAASALCTGIYVLSFGWFLFFFVFGAFFYDFSIVAPFIEKPSEIEIKIDSAIESSHSPYFMCIASIHACIYLFS